MAFANAARHFALGEASCQRIPPVGYVALATCKRRKLVACVAGELLHGLCGLVLLVRSRAGLGDRLGGKVR